MTKSKPWTIDLADYSDVSYRVLPPTQPPPPPDPAEEREQRIVGKIPPHLPGQTFADWCVSVANALKDEVNT